MIKTNTLNFSILKPDEQAIYGDFLPKGSNLSLLSEEIKKFESETDAKRKKIAKYSILGVAVLTVAGIIVSPKFLPKNVADAAKAALSRFKKGIENAISPELKQKSDQILEKAKNIGSKLNILNNSVTVKDAYAKKIYEYIPPLRWLDKKSSKLYYDTAVNMTSATFKKAFGAFDTLDEVIQGVLKGIDPKATYTVGEVQKSGGELTKEILELMQKRKSGLAKSFGAKAQERTLAEINGALGDIAPRFRKEFNAAIREKQYGKVFTYMVKDMVEGDKEKLLRRLNGELAKFGKNSEINSEIERLLKIICPDNSNEVTKLTQKATKALGRAVDTQGNIFFDKVRDISAGAAPTDFTGILTSMGGLGLYMAQADTKEERTSVALTTGIPFMLGIVSSTLATMKMISGFSSLAIGFATTIISSTLGKSLDKAYKKKYGIEDKRPSIITLEGLENSRLKDYTDYVAGKIIQ